MSETYRHPGMKQLKEQQTRYAPKDRRLEQVERAEHLLGEIEATKQYPYEYLCYRITGFRPEAWPALVLDGGDVQHDLRLFVEDLSATVRQAVEHATEPVLTVALTELAAMRSRQGGWGITAGYETCDALDTALALIAQCGSNHAGVCLDLFHYYTGPSKFEDLAYLSRDNLAWVQVCDLSGTPRELAGDRDRILPGEGDFQIDPILDHVGRIGYDGHVSLEVLNPQLWQVPADRVADLGHQAVCRVLGQWNRYPPETWRGA